MAAPLSPSASDRLAAIDPSWLQYIVAEFREFLAGGVDLTGAAVLELADYPLVEEIYQRLALSGEAVEAVRHDLWRKARPLRIIAVTSGKGGVGKTTISVNLSVAMAQLGQRVLLVDADLGMANVHVYAGIQSTGTLLDVVDGRRTLAQAVCAGPGGIHVLCGLSGALRAADLDGRAIAHLGAELRRAAGTYDVIVLDTGAGIASQVMNFLALADEIVLVATPNLASTLDAYGLIKVARERQIAAALHLLVNYAADAAEAEAVLHRIESCSRHFLQYEPQRLAVLARDAAFENAGQQRSPLVLSAGGEDYARQFSTIVRQLLKLAPASACNAA